MKSFNDDLQLRSDWYIPICNGNERIKINGRKAHSTQKPEALLHRIISATSNPGDIVLDPFAGSGTTLAVAKKLGRNFIGIERESFYVDIINRRLDSIKSPDTQNLGYPLEAKKPRVPFGNLIENGYIKSGELLYSKDRKHQARVLSNGTVTVDEICGSIHKVGAELINKPSCNGWTFWYVERDGALVSIDELRERFISESVI